MGDQNLSDDINRKTGEMLDGVDVAELPVGAKLKVQTRNTLYTIERIDNADWPFLISGHHAFCPEPSWCSIAGSMLKEGWIGVGMGMVFVLEASPHESVRTSAVQQITEVKDEA